MNGHASSAVSVPAGPSRLKANGSSVYTPSTVPGSSANSSAPDHLHASSPSSSSSNVGQVPGSYFGSTPNQNYASSPAGQAQAMYGYYNPYAAGYSPLYQNPGYSGRSHGQTGGYGRSNSHGNHHHQQQQQQHHLQQQQHMTPYDYNNNGNHGNVPGPSRYNAYQYNPYYPHPAYAQNQPVMQASPYPLYQHNAGYVPTQPVYYEAAPMYNGAYQHPGASMQNNRPYPYAPQQAPYPYAMPTPEQIHSQPGGPLPPHTPSSSHVSPYPIAQQPVASINNPPPPPPRESDHPPQPPPPISFVNPETEDLDLSNGINESDASVPVFASVLRPTPSVTKEAERQMPQLAHVAPVAETTAPQPASVPQASESPMNGTIAVKSAPNEEETNGFIPQERPSYLWAKNTPESGSAAPGLLYSSQISPIPSAVGTEWAGPIARHLRPGHSSAKRHHQNASLKIFKTQTHPGEDKSEIQFGQAEEVVAQPAESEDKTDPTTDEISAPQMVQEVSKPVEKPEEVEAKADESVSVEDVVKQLPSESETAATNAELAKEESKEVEPETAAPEVSAVVAPTPPAKVVPRSWAALLRPAGAKAIPSTAPITTDAEPIQSSEEDPQPAVGSPIKASPHPGTPTDVKAPVSMGYAAALATANSSPAWGGVGRPAEPDLGKLLSEGLAGLALSNQAGLTSVPRGLINTGNMCFANSILQVLAYCSPFTVLLQELSKRIKADLGGRTRLLEAMMLFLREFAATEMAGRSGESGNILADKSIPASAKPQPVKSGGIAKSGEAFVPTYVYEAMKENKRFDTMIRGHQEDAEEFMGFFLETLHEEMLYLFSRFEATRGAPREAPRPAVNGSTEEQDEREVSRPVSPSAGRDDGWMEVGKKQKTNIVRSTASRESAVSRTFGGKLRSVLHTPGQKDSVTLEPYQPLQLDISSPHVHTITEALLHMNEPETISGVYSASRGANVDATKTVYLETVPPILTLHLKRFLYDPVEMRVVKKGKSVAYGPELVIPSSIISPARRPTNGELRYRLFGVVYHHGSSATGGHYTACVLKQDKTGWLHLDDELVESVEGEAGVYVTKDAALQGDSGTVGRSQRSKCAYLLFYARI